MDGGMKEADEGALYTHREEGHPPDPCLSLPSGNRKGPISSATLFRDKEFRRLARMRDSHTSSGGSIPTAILPTMYSVWTTGPQIHCSPHPVAQQPPKCLSAK